MSSVDSLSLADKVAVITGSGRENGIGAGIALTLARAGARVTINYISESSASRAAEVHSNIESAVGKGRVALVKADVSTREGSNKIVDETLKAFGVNHIDIIVNCASFVAHGTILDSQPEDIMKTFQVAVVGPVLLLQATYPHMPHGGRIVNIGSVASKLGFVQMPIYASAKAAMDQLTFTLAREIGRDGKNITVNTVAPGPVLTDSLPPVPEVEPVKDYLISLTRAEERVGTVQDIADAVLLLASEKSRWITGQFISVSGGINGG
ncbi:Fc.00g010840.m01.CDS01 [Cosmosporella sp. VM-42]